MVDKESARALVEGKPWHHDFEIVPGVRTHGTYDPRSLFERLQLPAKMSGVSLADVGASNGYFSFESRKRGAQVAAFDYRHKDNSGFGLAQYINGMSDIAHHQVNVLKITREQYGQFDIVLALGLLYHVSDPYLALANCAALARERLLVESYCLDQSISQEARREPLMKFFSDPQRFPQYGHLNQDRSNFWGFTSVCLRRMIEDLGFDVGRLEVQNDRVIVDSTRSRARGESTRVDLAYGTLPATPHGSNPEDPHAWLMF